MDSSTSTTSLLLFPTWLGGNSETTTTTNQDQYHQLQLTASLPLPSPRPPPKPPTAVRPHISIIPHDNDTYNSTPPSSPLARGRQLFIRPPNRHLEFEERMSEGEKLREKEERRRLRREERKRQELTSFRSPDGLLSPPPVGTPRRRRKSTGSASGAVLQFQMRNGRSTPDLLLDDDGGGSGDRPVPHSAPTSPTLYRSPLSAHSLPDLGLANLSLDGQAREEYNNRSYSPSPVRRNRMNFQRPRPTKSRTADDAYFGMIQPPLPSLLRPKSFWKNHPRSALTGPSYSPSSYLVRRSTFVAAGVDIDDTDSSRLGRSLWNASTLALAVESRTESFVLVPGGGL